MKVIPVGVPHSVKGKIVVVLKEGQDPSTRICAVADIIYQSKETRTEILPADWMLPEKEIKVTEMSVYKARPNTGVVPGEIVSFITEEDYAEVILSIEDGIPYEGQDYYYDAWDGYIIKTDKQIVTLGISASPSCCESWGYFMTEDNLDNFIGAELRDIKITDTNLSNVDFDDHWSRIPGEPKERISLDCGDVMFVDIHTSVGALQFVAYNSHNGYYGHSAKVTSTQLDYEVTL